MGLPPRICRPSGVRSSTTSFPMSYVSMVPSFVSLPVVGVGCTVPSALNYDPTTAKDVEGGCLFGEVGCTDSSYGCAPDSPSSPFSERTATCYSPKHVKDTGRCVPYTAEFPGCFDDGDLSSCQPYFPGCFTDLWTGVSPGGESKMATPPGNGIYTFIDNSMCCNGKGLSASGGANTGCMDSTNFFYSPLNCEDTEPTSCPPMVRAQPPIACTRAPQLRRRSTMPPHARPQAHARPQPHARPGPSFKMGESCPTLRSIILESF